MVQIPFYKNRGYNCAEYITKAVLEYYFPSRRLNIKDIKRLLSRKDDENVYMFQLANAFSELDLEVEYFSEYGLDRFLSMKHGKKIEEFRKFFGNSANKIIKNSNFELFDSILKKIVNSGKWKNSSLRFSDLEKAFLNGKTIICLINCDLFYKRDNDFKGHYVVLTEISDSFVAYHNVGPFNAKPNKKVSKKEFANCWNKMCFFDEDTIFIKPKE